MSIININRPNLGKGSKTMSGPVRPPCISKLLIHAATLHSNLS